MNFRHFATLKEAKAFIAAHPYPQLVYRRRKNRKKPYVVGTPLAFLHFA